MVEISQSGSGEGPGWVTAPGYSTPAFGSRSKYGHGPPGSGGKHRRYGQLAGSDGPRALYRDADGTWLGPAERLATKVGVESVSRVIPKVWNSSHRRRPAV